MQQQKLPEENIYTFLGLKDFEGDKRKIKRAYGRIASSYALSQAADNSENHRLKKLQAMFTDMSDEEIYDYARDMMVKANLCKEVLSKATLKAQYDKWLEDNAVYLQNFDPENDQYVQGEQFFADEGAADNSPLLPFHKHLAEMNDDTGNPFLLVDKSEINQKKREEYAQQLLLQYHRFQNDAQKRIEHKPDQPKAHEDNDFGAEDYDGARKEPHFGDEIPDIDDDEADIDFDAVNEEEKSDANKAFKQASHVNSCYPKGGGDDPLVNIAMPFDKQYANYGDTDLDVYTAIDGKRFAYPILKFFKRENGFSLGGQLRVHGMRNKQAVMKRGIDAAINGRIDIACNGAYINGNIDGRVVSFKEVTKNVRNEAGQIVKQKQKVPHYKDGDVFIHAGDEDVVINGDLLGKVHIKTRGKVTVIGNVCDNVRIDAGSDIVIKGNIRGKATICSHENVTVQGKKEDLARTSKRAQVYGQDIDSEHLALMRMQQNSNMSQAEKAAKPKQQQPV